MVVMKAGVGGGEGWGKKGVGIPNCLTTHKFEGRVRKICTQKSGLFYVGEKLGRRGAYFGKGASREKKKSQAGGFGEVRVNFWTVKRGEEGGSLKKKAETVKQVRWASFHRTKR